MLGLELAQSHLLVGRSRQRHEKKREQLQKKIERTRSRQKLELEIGRTCNTLFRKWLKAPGEGGNGVPVRVVE